MGEGGKEGGGERESEVEGEVEGEGEGRGRGGGREMMVALPFTIQTYHCQRYQIHPLPAV